MISPYEVIILEVGVLDQAGTASRSVAARRLLSIALTSAYVDVSLVRRHHNGRRLPLAVPCYRSIDCGQGIEAIRLRATIIVVGAARSRHKMCHDGPSLQWRCWDRRMRSHAPERTGSTDTDMAGGRQERQQRRWAGKVRLCCSHRRHCSLRWRGRPGETATISAPARQVGHGRTNAPETC